MLSSWPLNIGFPNRKPYIRCQFIYKTSKYTGPTD
jgi:hypothetical protein